MRNTSTPFHLIFLATCLITACSPDYPEPPNCRIDAVFEDHRQGNAGCMIPFHDKVVTVTHRFSGKLDLPGGTSADNELAQCTAHRETWEETGLNVEVSKHLHTFENGYHLYLCTLKQAFPYQENPKAIPVWANTEVDSIQLVELFETHEDDWRYSEELDTLKDLKTQQVNPML